MTDWTELFRRGWPAIKIELHVHGTGAAGLGPVLEAVTALMGKVDRMAGEVDKIEAEVRENSDAIDSAVTLIEGLAQLVRDNASNPARLNAIADDLDRGSNRLAAAVVAGTPQAEPPVEDAPPPEDTPGEASFKRK